MTCPNCRHKVIFNPRKTPISDGKFRKLIVAMRGTGDTFFTKNQLYSSYLETGKVAFMTRLFLWLVVAISLVFIINVYYLRQNTFGTSGWVDVVVVGLFAGGMTGLFNWTTTPKVSRTEFEQWIKRWLAHYPIPNLITEPSLDQAPPPLFAEQDLYDYGVESIVVVDQDIYVDLFVQNNYLAEWKSVVISQNGYPNYLVAKVARILKENPSITIKYLHDAATACVNMKSSVRQFLTIPSTVEEVDLGLHSKDSNLLSVFSQRSKTSESVQLDFLPPARLATTMGAAVIGGLLIGEVLRSYQSSSSSGGDFG
jgi:hypothetical protein